jgi:hypothetical protein
MKAVVSAVAVWKRLAMGLKRYEIAQSVMYPGIRYARMIPKSAPSEGTFITPSDETWTAESARAA